MTRRIYLTRFGQMHWALSLEQYAQSTVDTLRAAGIDGDLDILGIHTGSIEAIEVALSAGTARPFRHSASTVSIST